MLLNTRFKLAALAGAFALAAAAPAAFAGSGNTYGGFHTDAYGAPDSPAARHSAEVMSKQSTPSTERMDHSGAASAGSSYGGFHTDPGGTPDAPAARHGSAVMSKPEFRSGIPANPAQGMWVPAY